MTACTKCAHPYGDDGLCVNCRGTFDPFPGTDATMFIQWKGTDVCMDFHCECGQHSHFDGDFAYVVKCMDCGTRYEMGTQVRARKLADHELLSSVTQELDKDDIFE